MLLLHDIKIISKLLENFERVLALKNTRQDKIIHNFAKPDKDPASYHILQRDIRTCSYFLLL